MTPIPPEAAAGGSDEASRSNPCSLWGAFVMRGLARLGVRQVVCSPGSRSTPLTFAGTRESGLTCLPILDERSAGFFALGLAKSSHRPVALVCTSGSALAHYGPAVIEASESGTPLLLMSADRPPSLRYSRSGQTIDQLKWFGDSVRYFAEFPLPEMQRERLYRQGSVLTDALHACCGARPGPVHLNFTFDDPLPPDPETQVSMEGDPLDFWEGPVASTGGSSQSEADEPERLPARGCILAGWAQPQDVKRYCRRVFDLARHLGWPIWADVSSPLRHAADPEGLVMTGYESVARSAEGAQACKPEAVILLGEPPTSKFVRQWLAEIQPVARSLDARLPAGNVMGLRQRHVPWDGRSALTGRFEVREPDRAFLASWQEAERRSRHKRQAYVEADGQLHEGRVSWILGSQLPAETPVFIASSLAIRDGEWFWPASDRGYRIQVNRGANGIDGTLSSAIGMACGYRRPSVLLTGDLAFLHDVGGLAMRRLLASHLTVIVIQNNGGGIFDHLPVARFDPPFEDYFATPQSFSIAGLAQAFGWDYSLVEGPQHLTELVADLPAGDGRILEVQTERHREYAWRQQYLNTESILTEEVK